MSLINDALKRAKAAQDKEPPAGTPPLQFQSSDPGQKGKGGFPWAVILWLAAVLLVGVVFMKVFSGKESALKVEAKAANPGAAAQTNDPSTVALSTSILPPAPKPTTVQPRTQEVVAAVSPAGAPRLQGLFYSPVHPSAVINGQTVFVGDKVGGFRVVDITRNSATLVSGTETNVLKFER
jgi:hypothetical protein